MNAETKEHPAHWVRKELRTRKGWHIDLSPADIADIDEALRLTESRSSETLALDDFPLPVLGSRLADVRETLEHGCGAVRVQGIDIDRYDEETAKRLFFGLSLHIGTPVSQSATGERLFHVRNEGFADNDPRARGPNTANKLSFHTDRCDVIGFFCWRQARSGGDNELVSSLAVYHHIREHRPDLVEVLLQRFPYKRHNVDTGNQLPYVMQPVFSFTDGYFACAFLRVLIDRADADPDCPDLSEVQREALDYVEYSAGRLSVNLRQSPGDILFLNNWVTLHRRTAFEDFTELSDRRCLFRIWLSPPGNRPIDPAFADNYGNTDANTVRGGMKPT